MNFAEKHPKLNTLIGFILLIALITIGVVIVKYVIQLLLIIGQRILTEASKIDTVVIVAFVTGSVSIISIVVSKIIEYRQKRREYLTMKREVPYSKFIDMVYKIQQSGRNYVYSQNEMIKDITSFSKDLTLWGSKKVVKKWTKFRKMSLEDKNRPPDNLFILEEIMNEMRKDLGMPKVQRGGLLSFFVNDIENYIK